MITAQPHNYFNKADSPKDCSLGNILFVIAGIIGVATKNGYKWGFKPWVNQEYFVNPLPGLDDTNFKPFQIPVNYQGFDIGFRGFNIPDNRIINGYFGSEKYWSHCDSLVRHYLTMKDICQPFEDSILMHYRNYRKNEAWNLLQSDYYTEALKRMPKKQVIVVTDNIEAAYNTLGPDYQYTSNSPIEDFYLLSHARYLIMANSSNSWMAAYLGQPEIVIAPENWYANSFKNCPKEDNYRKGWIRI